MDVTILIIAILIFILGYRYINYLKEYMYIRFGVDVLKRNKQMLTISIMILLIQLYVAILLATKSSKLTMIIIKGICDGSK